MVRVDHVRITEGPLHGIHQLVDDWARSCPEAVALTSGGQTMSYQELASQGWSLGRRLRARGVRSDSIVGIVADRSPELIVAMLGVLQTGGAYMALSPDLPPARLARQLADAAPAIVLASEASRPNLPRPGEAVPLESEISEAAAEAKGLWPDRPPELAQVHPDQLAYVCYTSGSTGEPKGVAMPHRGVVHLIHEPDFADFRSDDVFLQIAPAAFDASVFEIWAALAHGARLVLYPSEPVAADRLAEIVRGNGVTVLSLTAGLFHRVADNAPETFDGVRLLIAGGDTVSAAHVESVLASHPGLTVLHAYGPTENTTFSSVDHVERVTPGEPMPVGSAIRGTRIAILDDMLRPVPVGVAGDLYVTGDGLARGYLRRPAATAERFVPDPSGDVPGARLYRTGDLGRWRADGRIDFFGRADSQVKIHGYRVELGEIEGRLRGDPGVRDAVVTARPGPDGDRELAAYIVPSREIADGNAEVVRLRAWLADALPAYMVPRVFLAVRSLPLNANGKVDRTALAADKTAVVLRNEPGPQPGPGPGAGDPLEQVVADAWEHVLGTRVGTDENFFEAGGNSLLLIRLRARLNKVLDRKIATVSLFRHPTISEQVRFLAAQTAR
jgi:amino acid adenylation domain-containing protein